MLEVRLHRGSALLALVLTSILVVALAGTALATHPRQGSGTPLRVPLVNAFDFCSGADSVHVTGAASCQDVQQLSPLLTTGTSGVSSGFAKLTVLCVAPSTGLPPCSDVAGDQEDVRIEGSITDVQCKAVLGPTCTSVPRDFTGRVALMLPIRITDHASGPGPGPPAPCANGTGVSPCRTATVDDMTVGIPTTCVAQGSVTTEPGSNCSWLTTLDANFPGMVREQQRQVYDSSAPISVADPGADGSLGTCPPDCGTGDENPYRVQGWFAP